eukprot:11177596-Lingulodinium_polyedra.AAC.1
MPFGRVCFALGRARGAPGRLREASGRGPRAFLWTLRAPRLPPRAPCLAQGACRSTPTRRQGARAL